jgi:phosphatidate cytidylyltransferase
MIRLSNLGTRILVAVIGMPIIFAACILGKFFFLVFALAVGLVSYYEFSKMILNINHYANKLVGYLSVAVIILNAYYHFIDLQILFLIIVPLLFLVELYRVKGSATANVGSTLTGIFYTGLLVSGLILLREFYSDSHFTYDRGGYLIISVFASIWLCDSSAFFVGTAIGTHKILPRISPNKSWEGAIAGFIFSTVGMIAARFIVLDFLTMFDAIAIGIIVGVFGQAGDFVESMFKRDSNVKDSSSIIPGHGGVLDRFDSLIFSAPLIYLYLKFFAG